MDRATALELFEAIEEKRSSRRAEPRALGGFPVDAPAFLVRLDAGTDIKSSERFYKLFVRVDRTVPSHNGADLIGLVMELAKERGITATLENAGMELA